MLEITRLEYEPATDLSTEMSTHVRQALQANTETEPLRKPPTLSTASF
jgi:hypothetical protein